MKGFAKQLDNDSGFKNKLSNKLKSIDIAEIIRSKGGLSFKGDIELETTLKFKYLGMTVRVFSFKLGVNYKGKEGILVPVYLMNEQRQIGLCMPLLTYEQCGYKATA